MGEMGDRTAEAAVNVDLDAILQRLRNQPSSSASPVVGIDGLRAALAKVGLASETGSAYRKEEIEKLLTDELITPKTVFRGRELSARQV